MIVQKTTDPAEMRQEGFPVLADLSHFCVRTSFLLTKMRVFNAPAILMS